MKKINKITKLLEGGAKISHALKEVCGSEAIYIPFNDNDFDVPLQELKLSNRSYNSLRREGLNTLSDVVSHFDTKGWNSIKNFGKTSAYEVFGKIIDVAWDNMNDEQRARFLLSID